MSRPCTLCDHPEPVPEADALWGVDFPDCGPVHYDCASLDEWFWDRLDADLVRRIAVRRIEESGWLPSLADHLTVRREV